MSEQLRALERQLRDERSLRLQAEERVAQLTEQSQLWRTRAEERRDRIRALREEQDANWLTRTARALRRGAASAPAPGSSPAQISRKESAQLRPPTYPQIAVTAVGAPPLLEPVLREFRTSTELDERHLADADVVVVDADAVDRLPAHQRHMLAEWVDRRPRAPLAFWHEPESSRTDALSEQAELLLRPGTLPTFDADQHNPRLASVEDMAHRRESASTTDLGNLLQRAASATDSVSEVTPERLQLAATGLDEDGQRSATATRARRLAFRHHAPWIQAHELLRRLQLDVPGAVPRVAAIVMSNRPDELATCVEGVIRSRHVDLELVIGLHGIVLPERLRAVLDRLDRPFKVLDIPASTSLGEGLNRCIDSTGAPVLAKIDDDDHYGPAYLEDAVQALAYSGADLVGKGAQFTYLQDRDETILRRAGVEETWLDGAPTGASWVFRRSIWESVPFPHRPRRVDALLLAGARAIDARVYATSRWEFCYHRGTQGHTWDASDEILLAGAEACWAGFHPERVEVADDDARP